MSKMEEWMQIATDLQEDRLRLLARIRELEAQRDELLALVEQVEFIQDRGPRNRDYDVCPWCDSWMRDGHATDCPRQAVLAKARGQ